MLFPLAHFPPLFYFLYMHNPSEWRKLNALALHHREGWRVFHSSDDAEIRYEIAPLADTLVVMQMKAAYRCGDNHMVTIPWRAYSSRNEALRAFLGQAKKHFSYEASPEQKPTQKRILALLRSTDAGFREPEPEPVERQPEPSRMENTAPQETPPLHAEKIKKRGEKPVQKELF